MKCYNRNIPSLYVSKAEKSQKNKVGTYHSIEAVIETDIEDFTNVTPVMMIWEITESISTV